MKGERFADPCLGTHVVNQLLEELDPHPIAQASPLSAREHQVLGMTAAGYNNREIAERLGVGVKSVDTYRQRVMAKLGLRSRAEVTRYALHMGISERQKARKRRP
jgi:two-component system response regulator NreC